MHAKAYWPQARGFDTYSGYLQGCGSQDTHISSCCGAPANASDFENYVCPGGGGGKDYRGGDWWANYSDATLSANRTSSSELIAALAEDAITNWAQSPEPFFLYLPFQNIHAPYDAMQESVQRFASLSASIQQKTMFAYLYELDVAVGRVVAALNASGILSDSLIAFVSDNGAPQAPGVDDRNYPLRGFKSETFEGGTRVPAFYYAPGRLPAGRVVDSLVSVTDLLPTLVTANGGTPPANIDGVDQWETLLGGAAVRNEVVVNVNHLCDGGQFGAPKAALRVGEMKLLCFCFSAKGIAGANTTGCKGDPAHPGAWPLLFNLTEDPSETNNLAADLPDVVTALEARLVVLAGPSAAVEPMQWTPPYQGPDYYCADCPLRNATGPFAPWSWWLPDPTKVKEDR